MPHLVAALFQNYATAERALQALMEAGVVRDRIAVVGEREGRQVSSISGFRELSARDDLMAELHDLPLPDEDLRLFEAGLCEGHVLITARVERSNLDEAVAVIDMFDPLDLDQKGVASTHQGSSHGRAGADVGGPLAAGLTGGAGVGQTNTAAVPGMGSMTDRTDDLGTADLRTTEASTRDMGLSSTTATGHRREEERAGRPGVLEMDQSPGGSAASRMTPAAGEVRSPGGQDLYRRDLRRIGRVRAYDRD